MVPLGPPTRRGHKRVDTKVSTLLWITPFPLESLAQITDM